MKGESMDVGFIGLGTMGSRMALNILRAGHNIAVHNRTRDRELFLAENGARRASSPSEAASGADIVITCVSDTPDVEEIILGKNGVINGIRSGAVVVDMSTISPQATQAISGTLLKKGIRMIDAPVTGGSEGAEKGTLSIMVGGESADLEFALPVLKAMGKTITHVGPIGSGQMTKAINQSVAAGIYYAVAEGLVLGMKAGLNMENVIKALTPGVAGSWVLSNRAQNMIQNNYPLGFRVRLHQKDLRIALDTARELGVFMPLASFVAQVENSLVSQGHGDKDVSALALSVREQSGIR